MRRATPAALALATIAGALLVGCTPDEPAATTPPPTAERTLSDEEIARDAFDRYWVAFESVQGDETVDASAFADVATPELAEDVAQGVETDYQAQFWSTGLPVVETVSVEPGTTDARLEVQFCADMTAVLPVLEGEVSERLPGSNFLIYEGTIEIAGDRPVFGALSSAGSPESGTCD